MDADSGWRILEAKHWFFSRELYSPLTWDIHHNQWPGRDDLNGWGVFSSIGYLPSPSYKRVWTVYELRRVAVYGWAIALVISNSLANNVLVIARSNRIHTAPIYRKSLTHGKESRGKVAKSTPELWHLYSLICYWSSTQDFQNIPIWFRTVLVYCIEDD